MTIRLIPKVTPVFTHLQVVPCIMRDELVSDSEHPNNIMLMIRVLSYDSSAIIYDNFFSNSCICFVSASLYGKCPVFAKIIKVILITFCPGSAYRLVEAILTECMYCRMQNI